MSRLLAWLRRSLGAWRAHGAAARRVTVALVAGNANTCVFLLGLVVLTVSVSAWSRPLAGVIFGVVLMAIAAWPFLQARKAD